MLFRSPVIEDPNSSGQGFAPSHKDNPFHDTLLSHGYKYSHSTPVGVHGGPGEKKAIHHIYGLPGTERKASVWQNPDNRFWKWSSSPSSGSGIHTVGSSHEALRSHLKRVTRGVVRKSEDFIDIANQELLAHQLGLFKAEPKKQPDPNEPPPEENKAKHLEAMAHHAMHRNFHIHAAKTSTDPKSSHWDAAEHHEKMFKDHAEAAGLKGNKKLIDQHLAGDQNPVFAEHPYDKLLVKKD